MMSPAPYPSPGSPRGFAPRAVPWGEAPALLAEAGRIVAAAPARLLGLYLLLFLPLQLLLGMAYLAMPLRGILASIGFAAYYGALEAARSGRPPGLADLGRALRLPADKLGLLVLAGLVPVLLIWLGWGLDLGPAALDQLLSAHMIAPADGGDAAAAAAVSAGEPALAQRIEEALIDNLAAIPLLLLQPMCTLYGWSATRTFSANLLASLANWRWGCLLAALLVPLELALFGVAAASDAEQLLVLGLSVVLGLFLSALTLALLHRSLD
jgi:hypothetical protein